MKMFKPEKFIEEYGYLLDYFNDKRVIEVRGRKIFIKGLIGQIVGEERFILMEFKLNEEASYEEIERIYIGRGERFKAIRFIRYIGYDELTYKSKENLPRAVEKAVRVNEEKWIDFFNRAGLITPRTHSLELLSLIGRKTVERILEEREKEKFKNFGDIKNRLKIDPVRAIVDRVLNEIKGECTHYLFVKKVKP
jgi:putative nucleotide binding protein